MPDFVSLETAIQRAYALCALAFLGLLGVAVAALVFSYNSQQTVQNMSLHNPVLVVPGAVGGLYTPGLTEEQVRATARYLANLATNFHAGDSFTQRFNELESYASPQYLPRLQMARSRLQHDVDSQNQARSFYGLPHTETLENTQAQFIYRITGERNVYASGLPMDHHQSQITLELSWGVPSNTNRSGIVLNSLRVIDTDTPSSDAKTRSAS